MLICSTATYVPRAASATECRSQETLLGIPITRFSFVFNIIDLRIARCHSYSLTHNGAMLTTRLRSLHCNNSGLLAHHPRQNLIRRMLTVDPARRITAKEILAHPWISGDSTVSLSAYMAHTALVHGHIAHVHTLIGGRVPRTTYST